MKALRVAMMAAAALIMVALVFLVPFLFDSTKHGSLPTQHNLPDGGRSTIETRSAPAPPPERETRAAADKNTDPGERPQPARPGAEPATDYQLSGRVTDLAGIPVPDAILRIRLTSGDRAATLERRTDSEGRFHLDHLPRNVVPLITVQAQDYQELTIENIDLPARDLAIYLKPLASIILEVFRVDGENLLPWAGEVTLHILRRQESPSVNSQVEATVQSARGGGGFSAVRSLTAKSPNGVHRLTDIPPGIYRVVAQAGTEYAESEPFTVEPVGASRCRIILGERVTMRGRVVCAETSASLAGAVARLIQSGRPAVAGAGDAFETRADSDGAFEFEGVVPGQYTLVLGADGYSTRSLEEMTVRAGQTGETVIYELVKGEARLTVRVFGPSGQPAAGVRLALLNQSPAGTARARFATTNQAGVAHFEPILAGRYSLSLTYAEQRPRQKTMEVLINEGEAREVDVRFQPLVRVVGTAKRGGAAYEGLIAFVARGNVAAEDFARADATGAFAVDLEPGEYVVGRPGQAGTVQITVPAVATFTTDLMLD